MLGRRACTAALCVLMFFSAGLIADATAAPTVVSFSPASGFPPLEVRIVGSGFTGASEVRIGSQVVGPFVVESDQAINATLDANPTLPPYVGRVSVTTAEGTGVSEAVFTEVSPYPPYIHSVSPTVGPVGASVVIQGGPFDASTSVSFNGVLATATVIRSRQEVQTVVPAGATTGPLAVANSSGIGSPASQFAVGDIPVIDDFSPKSGGVGTLVRVTGSGLSGVASVNFTGKLGFGGRSPVPAQVYSASENELYTMVPGGQVDDGPITVVAAGGVRRASTIPFLLCSGFAISTPARVCATTTSVATLVTTPGATFQWTATNAAIVSGATSNVMTYQPDGTGPVRLRVVRATSSCPGGEASIEVQVGPPSLDFSLPDTACASSVVTTSVVGSVNMADGLVYEWSVTNGTPVSRNDGQTFSFTTGVAGEAAVTLRAMICGAWQTLGTKTVSIDAVPRPSIIAPSIGGVNVASSASVTIAAGSTVVWSILNGTITGPTDRPWISFTPASAGTTTLTASVTACGRVGSSSATVQVLAPAIERFEPTFGAPGTVVDVYGRDLTGTIGGRLATPMGAGNVVVTVVDDDHVRFTVPIGAVTSPITLSTPSGQAISAKAFTVCGSQLWWSSTYPQCPGQSGTQSLPDMVGATYDWTVKNATVTAGAGTASITYQPESTAPVEFTVRVVDGCGATHVLSTTGTLPAPRLNAPASVCPSAVVSINAPPIAGGTWNVINATILSSTPSNILFQAPASGTVVVERLTPTCGGASNMVSRAEIAVGMPPAVINGGDDVGPGASGTARAMLVSRAAYRWEISGGTLLSYPTSPYVDFTRASSGETRLTLTMTLCGESTTATKVLGTAPAPSISNISPTIGSSEGGEEVTIAGSDLGGVSEVRFGTAAGTIVYATPTEVVVRTPPVGASTVDVSVTSAGVTTTAPNAFLFTEPVRSATVPSSDPQKSAVVVAGGSTTLTFDAVTAAGTTTVTRIDPTVAGTVPHGYLVDGSDRAWEIRTTATYSGSIVIAFHLPEIADEVEFNSLRVLHGESGGLVDVTVLPPDAPAPDFAGRLLYARVTSLSPFVIGRTQAPRIMSMSAPLAAVPRGQTASFSAAFEDLDVETHTATINWGDGSVTPGVVVESGRSGSLSATHAYASAGVYALTLTVTDQTGLASSAVYRSIVVYDVNAGSVTAGGWVPEPGSGKATFSTTARYDKNGELAGSVHFEAGSVKVRSKSLEWLVVDAALAQLRGVAAVDGVGECVFVATFVDGARRGDGVDRVRLQLWNAQTRMVLFDTSPGAVDGFDAGVTRPLGGGDVTIHD